MSKELTKEEIQREITPKQFYMKHFYINSHYDFDNHKGCTKEGVLKIMEDYSAQKQKRIDSAEGELRLEKIKIDRLLKSNKALQQSLQTAIEALDRISNTYDNLEDLAGVIAKETLQKINKK